MHVRRDPVWAAAIVEAGKGERTSMGSVVECDVIGSGQALVVAEVQTHPRVHRSIAVVSRSDNYGMAPITVGSAVLFVVHADCYFQQRDVTRDECDLLRLAAEGLAAHLSRLLLLEGLRYVEHGVTTSWTRAARGCTGTRSERHPSPQEGSNLTVRERDVIRLMAAGDTNYAIARRLSVSEGTVKTHVSHILQKLQAANRAQAVSRWLDG